MSHSSWRPSSTAGVMAVLRSTSCTIVPTEYQGSSSTMRPSGAMTALRPTVEMLTTLRPSSSARMRAMVERTVLLANKDRLHAARAGASANKTTQPQPVIPIAEARERLRQALASNAHDDSFTLAARKETELSDADVLDMLQAMRELGIIK